MVVDDVHLQVVRRVQNAVVASAGKVGSERFVVQSDHEPGAALARQSRGLEGVVVGRENEGGVQSLISKPAGDSEKPERGQRALERGDHDFIQIWVILDGGGVVRPGKKEQPGLGKGAPEVTDHRCRCQQMAH
jgi:hypothetical protein